MNPYVNSLNGYGGGFIGFWPSGEAVAEEAFNPRGSGGREEKELPTFITNLDEKRRLDQELEHQRALDDKRKLEALAVPENIGQIGLTEAQKLELIAFLEEMQFEDQEVMLQLSPDELLAIYLLMQ